MIMTLNGLDPSKAKYITVLVCSILPGPRFTRLVLIMGGTMLERHSLTSSMPIF